jgi:hypothetical protein
MLGEDHHDGAIRENLHKRARVICAASASDDLANKACGGVA